MKGYPLVIESTYILRRNLQNPVQRALTPKSEGVKQIRQFHQMWDRDQATELFKTTSSLIKWRQQLLFHGLFERRIMFAVLVTKSCPTLL